MAARRVNPNIVKLHRAYSIGELAARAKDFKRFHREQAVAFKARLGQARNTRTGERISKATMLSTLRDLRSFFFWLAHQPGFKSHIAYDDSAYFNLSDKDVAVARARREKQVPSVDQINHVLAAMPGDSVLARRDQALVAFAALTGARVGALASFRLGHVDLSGGSVEQDARTVQTKFSKTFRTYFMPVCQPALAIVSQWAGELQRDHLWGPNDPLFPATAMGLGNDHGFVAIGLARHGWATPILPGVCGGGPALFQPAQFPRHAGASRHEPESFARRDESLEPKPGPCRCADYVHLLWACADPSPGPADQHVSQAKGQRQL
ncbi:hypothetical protein [Sandarakinorhabdus sp.]|uniref:site-specific integrase n=1 Tax=Sandarakinorhabdus sp. TaxID=1916663 RepID=UPI00286E4CA1|nr:hypothetical protein [Sandarakinorhabdus sp.]